MLERSYLATQSSPSRSNALIAVEQFAGSDRVDIFEAHGINLLLNESIIFVKQSLGLSGPGLEKLEPAFVRAEDEVLAFEEILVVGSAAQVARAIFWRRLNQSR